MPSISIPAAAIATGLGSLGVGATTAGILGTIGSTALTGAGVGAATAGLTGGKVLKGAGYGALAGGTLGAGGELFAPEAMGALSSGDFTGAMGALSGAPATAATEAQGAMDAAYGVPSVAGEAAAPGALNSLSGMVGKLPQIAGVLSGLSGPPKPNYGAMPGPGQNAATLGPYWNQPAVTSGYINRTPNAALNNQPASSWYTYGQRPAASFFNDNAITFPGGGAPGALNGAAQARQSGLPPNVLGPLGYARGGRLFAGPKAGEHFVRGPGTTTSDSIPAMLSDGEYVLDAEDVKKIGGGSNELGAKRLDRRRKEISKGGVTSPLAHLLKSRRAA